MTENNNTAKTEADILHSLVEAMQQDASDAEESPEPSELEQLQSENAELKDKLLRAIAEGDNIRRRAERDLQENSKFAITGFARDLVSVFENLHRASSSITEEMRRDNPHVNNLAMGVQMTLKEMESVLGKHKVQRHDPMGEMFNHQLHQAMTKIETADHPEGTIMQVMQAAYTIHERLLQPALVAVAAAPASSSSPESPHVDTTA
jgi:molecular chaperone GrpE